MSTSNPPPEQGSPPPWSPPAGWSAEQPPAWTGESRTPVRPDGAPAPSGGQPGQGGPPGWGGQPGPPVQGGQPGWQGPAAPDPTSGPPPPAAPGWAAPPAPGQSWGAPAGQDQPGWGTPPPAPPGWGTPPPAGQGWGPPVQHGPPHPWSPPPQAPKPGIIALRPLGVGELLDGALGLIRSNPRTVLMLAGALSLLVGAFQAVGLWVSYAALGDPTLALAGDEVPALTDVLPALAAQALPSLLAGLVQVLASGLFIVLVGAAALGRRLDAGRTWALLRPRLGALLGLTLLVVVGVVVLVAAGVGVIALLIPALGGWAALPGAVLALTLASLLLFLYVRLAMASPAVVMEALGPLAAVRRSWGLVRGSWWRVLGVLLLSAIVVSLLTAVVSVPVTMLTTLLFGLEGGLGPVLTSSVLATVLAGVVTLPFSAAMVGLLYIDLRMRHEMLHLQLAAAHGAPGADPLAAYRR